MPRAIRVETLVVGGGIGGMAAALALARLGRPTHVLEQAETLGEIGAGIQLAPNALRVLDHLGVLDGLYNEAVFPPEATMIDAATGERLVALDFGDSFLDVFGYPYIVSHRSDLHASLVDACAASDLVTVETDRQVTSVDQADERVFATVSSGEVYEADALIGADGIHSTVRTQLIGETELVVHGEVAYRGTVPYDAIPERDDKDNMTWWVGPGMHLIQYPLRHAELFNQVAVFTSKRFTKGSECWGTLEELDERFADKTFHVRKGVEKIDRTQHWNMVDREPVPNWTVGRATLLGDAAHPMLQYLAQGSCQAMEDAAAIAYALSEHNSPNVAFKSYQDSRIARTSTVQTWARYMGQIVHADGVTRGLRNALLSTRDSRDLSYVNWLYGYEVPRVF